jgi:nicotinamide mononucleotide transporter
MLAIWISYLDAISCLFSFLATYCAIKVKRITWFWTFLACIVNIVLYDVDHIYAQMLLQWVYIGMAVYGWRYWLERSEKEQNKPIQLISWGHVLFALTFIVSSSCLWYLLLRHTDSTTLWSDSLTTGIFLAAQIMACQKKILNWCLWFLADIMCIFLYADKGLRFHTGLFILYLFLACYGYWSWYQEAKKEQVEGVGMDCREQDLKHHGVAPTGI